jgi:hypothetical protein
LIFPGTTRHRVAADGVKIFYREAGPANAGMRREYSSGISDPDLIAPESYTLDAALLGRPRNVEIQVDLFRDYANNVKLYPAFHEYFRKWKPPLLAIWGKNDPYFIPPGAGGVPARHSEGRCAVSRYRARRAGDARRRGFARDALVSCGGFG